MARSEATSVQKIVASLLIFVLTARSLAYVHLHPHVVQIFDRLPARSADLVGDTKSSNNAHFLDSNETDCSALAAPLFARSRCRCTDAEQIQPPHQFLVAYVDLVAASRARQISDNCTEKQKQNLISKKQKTGERAKQASRSNTRRGNHMALRTPRRGHHIGPTNICSVFDDVSIFGSLQNTVIWSRKRRRTVLCFAHRVGGAKRRAFIILPRFTSLVC